MSKHPNNILEEIRQHYKILDMTIERRPPYYDLEGSRRHGMEKIDIDFGSPDIDFIGETKIEYFLRMMAAAPKMLQALELILPLAIMYELETDDSEPDEFDPKGVIGFAELAIAKAKGEQP